MNFQITQPFDVQLSTLLALLILFEKKIEQTRKKLSGNEQFHTRLIFTRMDIRKKGEISPEDIIVAISPLNRSLGLEQCRRVCRKYTVSGAFSYEELLGLIVPKNDKALAQRVLIRTAKRGAALPDYLWRYFSEMFLSLISMVNITQALRVNLQKSQQNLNHLQMVYFFQRTLKSPHSIYTFCNQNIEANTEYSFETNDVHYLSNNVRSGNSIHEFTDQDIKELICPLDMNFQKTQKEMAGYYENIRYEKEKTMNGAFYTQTISEQQSRKNANTNFLNSHYQSLYPATKKTMKTNQTQPRPRADYPQPQQHVQIEYAPQKQNRQSFNLRQPKNDNILLKPSRVVEDNYLNNFIKNDNYSQNKSRTEHKEYFNSGKFDEGLIVNYNAVRAPTIELDRYLSGRYPQNQNYEKFDDQLPENIDSSVSNSAFVQY